MLHIILDTVVDIWNKTYIKLPTLQLEILRITTKNVDMAITYTQHHEQSQHAKLHAARGRSTERVGGDVHPPPPT